ncbi:MAG: FtsX-like permease family protein [Cyclobacteriaceae bacterium]|nr:ABC transporter permease [Cyclobacteriaceae bacterium]
MYSVLAWRNIWRNKRRSLITILSITFAVLLACAMRSMQLGSYDRMIENSVRFYMGYIQIHKDGYWNDKVIDNSFHYDSVKLNQVTEIKGVQTYVPRLESFALASYKNQTKGSLIMGVDPRRENDLTRVKEKLVEGSYLTSDDEGVLVSKGLAEYLNATVGDTLVLLGQGYHGANAAGLFPIKGIVRFAMPEQNNQMIYMSLAKAQWFYAADQLITSAALLIDDADEAPRIVREIKKSFSSEDFEVMDWKELVPDLIQSIELDSISGKIMLMILYVVIGFGMFGTYLMMTAERQYEFGVMLAVGMKRLRLQTIILLEITMMTAVGVLVGITISLPLLTYFHFNPIYFSQDAAKAIENFGVEAVYAFSLDPTIFTNQAYAIFIMAIILAGYPVWSIYKMNPVESMRA